MACGSCPCLSTRTRAGVLQLRLFPLDTSLSSHTLDSHSSLDSRLVTPVIFCLADRNRTRPEPQSKECGKHFSTPLKRTSPLYSRPPMRVCACMRGCVCVCTTGQRVEALELQDRPILNHHSSARLCSLLSQTPMHACVAVCLHHRVARRSPRAAGPRQVPHHSSPRFRRP